MKYHPKLFVERTKSFFSFLIDFNIATTTHSSYFYQGLKSSVCLTLYGKALLP